MHVVIDLTWTPEPQSAIESLLLALDPSNDSLTVTCGATDIERVLSLRPWIKNQRNPVIASNKPMVWHPSGIDAAEVDACLLAAFVTPMAPDLIISDLLAKAPQGVIPIIKIADLKGQETDGHQLGQQLKTWATSMSKGGAAIKPDKNPKLKLALVSPFPPARSGVADCSAELLTGLREHYDVTLIDTTPEDLQDRNGIKREFEGVQSLAWFIDNAKRFSRVVYQLGNSPYHSGMWPAMAKIPGIAALHDLTQGDHITSEQTRGQPHMWHEVLLYEHGYQALACEQADHQKAVQRYAGNYRVFRDALGVVLHSRYAAQLAESQVGPDVADRIRVIPLVRKPASTPTIENKRQAREALGLPTTGTIVCSFGYVAKIKSPVRIVQAWRDSQLSKDPSAQLFFVGHNHPGDVGEQLTDAIAELPYPDRVKITGFVDTKTFTHYLNAADFAVQLRLVSRGETSGAALHAMAHGLPQIVNANGAFAELDREAVWMLPDDFSTEDLVLAMNTLDRDPKMRQAMAERGPTVIEEQHSPTVCGLAYRDFIEACYDRRLLSHPRAQLAAIKHAWPDGEISTQQRASLANAIDFNRTAMLPRPRLLLDLTTTHNTDLQTGIQRVALAIFDALLKLEPKGLVVTPVYLENKQGQWHYYQANEFMTKRLDLTQHWLSDHQVMPRTADMLLTLDLSTWQLQQADDQGLFRRFQACGVRCAGIVYDLLPITMPTAFPPTAKETHQAWLSVINQFDGALCISKHVATELARWRNQQAIDGEFRIGSFMLGADTETFGLPSTPRQQTNSQSTQLTHRANDTIQNKTAETKPPVFLMVGTIEPRKAYLEAIGIFSNLWDSGFDATLVIVGREGWKHLNNTDRHDIPATVDLLRNHPERFSRFRWLDNADDAALKRAYESADCLIAASYDEGFGLPIIEATRHGVPVLARDIAVFREVAPAGTAFFKDGELAQAIRNWTKPEHPPKDEHTITWRESAQQVLQWLNEERT